jgi:hypothetical protein
VARLHVQAVGETMNSVHLQCDNRPGKQILNQKVYGCITRFVLLIINPVSILFLEKYAIAGELFFWQSYLLQKGRRLLLRLFLFVVVFEDTMVDIHRY